MIKNYFMYCTILFFTLLLINRIKGLLGYLKLKKYKSVQTLEEKVQVYIKMFFYCYIPILNIFLTISTLVIFFTRVDEIINYQLREGKIYKL